MNMKKLFAALLACLLALTAFGAFAEVPGIEAGISGIQKYGNIVLTSAATRCWSRATPTAISSP